MPEFSYVVISLGLIAMTNLILLLTKREKKTLPHNAIWPIHAKIVLNIVFALAAALSFAFFRPMFLPLLVICTIGQITLTVLSSKVVG